MSVLPVSVTKDEYSGVTSGKVMNCVASGEMAANQAGQRRYKWGRLSTLWTPNYTQNEKVAVVQSCPRCSGPLCDRDHRPMLMPALPFLLREDLRFALSRTDSFYHFKTRVIIFLGVNVTRRGQGDYLVGKNCIC